MAPPKCLLCPRDSTRLVNPALRELWKTEEGLKWHWHTDSCAWWRLCTPCHNATWPEDHRVRNGASKPWHAVTNRWVAGFYLTRPPPELLREAFAKEATSQPRRSVARARSRSPVPPSVRLEPPISFSVDSLLGALLGKPALLEPQQPSCLLVRPARKPRPVDLGPPASRLRFYPDANSCRPALRGLMKFFRGAAREEIIEIPMRPQAEKQPFHPLPAICDAVEEDHERHWGRLPPTFQERVGCGAFVEISGDPANTHLCLLCPPCRVKLISGQSLRLRDEVFGRGVTAQQHFRAVRRQGPAEADVPRPAAGEVAELAEAEVLFG